MPVNFPPIPVYPDALDTDYTLFLVYNTTETVITTDNQPWAEEIHLQPVRSTDREIWADNGFANIAGELLYYDSVEKNAYGKVITLKNCVRNLGGEETRFNIQGTDIRSYVIAEHHNQLVEATINIERYLGGVVCKDTDTLICCLDETDVDDCPDDSGCPEVNFSYKVLDDDLCTGTLIAYNVDIKGEFNEFRIDFGDGDSTTTAASGIKQYPPGEEVDPVVTVANDLCEIVQTSAIRTIPTEPEGPESPGDILIPIPEVIIPDLDVVGPEIPEPDISIPPIVLPPVEVDVSDVNISIPGFSIDIPSVICVVPPIPSVISLSPSIPAVISVDANIPSVISVDTNIPSIISITPIDIPSIISFGPVTIPSIISFGPVTIPSIITVIDSIPNPISVVGMPGSVSVTGFPDLVSVVGPSDCLCVDWGTPPTLSVEVTCNCTCSDGGTGTGFAPTMRQLVEDGYYDFDDEVSVARAEVNYDTLGIPSQIIIEPPKISPIPVEHNLPTKITLDAATMPSVVDIRMMEKIPTEINVLVPSEMPEISLNASALPEALTVDWGDAPREISLITPSIPSVLVVEHDIPSIISVEGMPNIISIEGFPDTLPPLRIENTDELLLRIENPEVKVTLDVDKLLTNDEGSQYCFALVPCKP